MLTAALPVLSRNHSTRPAVGAGSLALLLATEVSKSISVSGAAPESMFQVTPLTRCCANGVDSSADTVTCFVAAPDTTGTTSALSTLAAEGRAEILIDMAAVYVSVMRSLPLSVSNTLAFSASRLDTAAAGLGFW